MEHSSERRFVDLHTHILPGVDDGAENLETALEMLQRAWENGTGTLFLTPHYRGRYKKNTPQHLREIFDELSRKASERFPELRLYLGHEAGNEHELADKLLSGRVMTLGGTCYVLLEFDEHCYRSGVLSSILNLINSGYIPVIAHVERYEIFRKNHSLAGEVINMGAMLQVNAGSVMGRHGLGVKLYCQKLLRRGQIHFVASDAHDLKDRPPVLNACFARISKRYGRDYAQAVFAGNAERILSESDHL